MDAAYRGFPTLGTLNPEPLTADSPVHGDHDLVTQFRQFVPEKPALFGASVAVVDPALPTGSAVCGIGYPTDHTFLLGSIGKALNGLIYSGMVADGLVHPQDTLDRFLPLTGTPAGRITLESLLTHTSGLPTTGGGRRDLLRMNWRLFRGRDPQPETRGDLLRQLTDAPVTGPGHFHYSNLGGSALGHALAAAAGTSYPQLVADHLAAPAGRPSICVTAPGEPDGPLDAPSFSVFNKPGEAWTGEGYAPAGGVRASAEDMAVLMHRLLNDPLPGWEDAFTPLFRVDPGTFIGPGNRIGAGWFIQDATNESPELVWHNGYAAGFGSAIVLDRGTKRGAFVSVIDGTMQADPVPTALTLLHPR